MEEYRMFVLVPMWYYDSGYAGTVSDLSLSMSGELIGYEAYKAFTTDDREYLKVTNSNIDMTSPYTCSGLVQGVVMVSEDFFTSTSNALYLYKDDNQGFSSPTVKNISTIYGDGTSGGSYIYAGGTSITGRTKTFATYTADTSYQYYRFTIGPSPLNQKINLLCHGGVYTIPSGYRIQDYETKFTNRGSVVKTNLLGNVFWDGLQNNSLKREHQLVLEYMTGEQKDELVSIFTLGRGILPVWFIDDENDNDTWMYAAMTSMSVTETAVEYYNVTIDLREY